MLPMHKHANKTQCPLNVTKEFYRNQIWNYMEKNNIASFPRPVHGRIPNFKKADEAGKKLLEIGCFKTAKSVEVNPDKPLQECRFQVLNAGKELFVPVPRLKTGLLKRLRKDSKVDTRQIVSRWGLDNLGELINIKEQISIDLLVLGSVAVSENGYRIGKGKGFADLEFAILKELNAVNDDTVIVTSVHDCQVIEHMPGELFKKYDVPVDIILTPTRIIEVQQKLPRPKGIYWSLLLDDRVKEMEILQTLKHI